MNETILVRLDETPTSGYRWAVEHVDEKVLASEGSEFELPTDAAIGAAGHRTFAYKAISRGTARIALTLRREWEGPGSAIDRFEVSVVVQG